MKKIVLIEDNLDVRESTQEILELADYEVHTAENGKIGVELVKSIKPDIVLCDIMMPELDGYGVLRILSKNPDTSRIPFIFISAKSEISDLRKGMNLGADDYITKPFEDTDLLEAIETRLKKLDKLQQDFPNNIEGLNEFINHARGYELLNDLSKDRKLKKFSKKDYIYREHDYVNYVYYIVSGKVKCFKSDEYGKDLVNDIHQAGDFIGYMTLFDREEYHESCIAMEETEVAVIPKHEFLSLVQKNRDVSTNFIKMLSGEIQEKERRLLQLAYASVRERVADSLLTLKEKNNGSEKLFIPREDLANIVGTATESLIRTLTELKNEGILETEGKGIIIVNEQALRKAATGF